MMPGMDGLALCRALRADAAWARIPVVLHTSAHANRSEHDPPLWDASLRKPARMHDFLATVERLVHDK
jgi:CheY-like chemotaxis protein